MSLDRTGIFEGADPIEIAQRWLVEAQGVEPNDANAGALASVDGDGMPNVRIVLVKDIEADGFVFFTNYDSAKGQELDQSGKAALGLHWKSLRRQIRVRGVVARVAGDVSDAYYQSRALESRIGAWASQQSRPLVSRDVLRDDVARLSAELGATPTRPKNWGGYRITPLEIEFWADGAFRLHDRFCWRRKTVQDDWQIECLFP